MKKLALIFSITGVCGALKAQQKELFNAEEYLRKRATKPFLNKTSPVIKHDISGIFQPYNKNIFNSFEPGQMPCIKPDINSFKIMPNPAAGLFNDIIARIDFPGAMPNPSPSPAISAK